MQIIRRLGNNYDLVGLTLGRLMAIEDALKSARELGELSPVGEEVLRFFTSQSLVEPNPLRRKKQ